MKSRIGTGTSFSKQAVREFVERPEHFNAAAHNGALLRLIFASKVGVIAPPLEYNDGWVLLVVRQIIPGYQPPLSKTRPAIIQILKASKQHEALERFVRDFRKTWIAKTSCSAGFIVQKCAQYMGASQPEEELLPFAA